MPDLIDRSETRALALRPLLARSVAATLLLAGNLTLALLLLAAFAQRLMLLRQIRDGDDVESSAFATSDTVIMGMSRLVTPLALVTGVAFLLWLYRATQNARALRSESLEFTPGEAARSFFIPFINLVRPYQAVREVWRASNPCVPPLSSASFRSVGGSSLVLVWWLLYLARNFSGIWTVLVARTADSQVETLISGSHGAIVVYALTIGAASAAIALVFLIERRLDTLARAAELQGPQDPSGNAE